jgi:hypothetical protein
MILVGNVTGLWLDLRIRLCENFVIFGNVGQSLFPDAHVWDRCEGALVHGEVDRRFLRRACGSV